MINYRNGLLLSIASAILLLISLYWVPWFIFLSFIPLFFACYKSNHTFKYGFATGFLFGAGLIYWVLAVDAPIRGWLWLGALFLFTYFGLIFGFSMWLSSRIKRFYLIPIIWTSVEFFRGLSSELGFPWGSMGYMLMPYLKFVQFAEFIGLPGITFFILLINTLLFYAIKKRNLRYMYTAIIIILGVWLQGIIAFKKNSQITNNKSQIKIGVIQPNISPETKRGHNLDYRLSTLYELSKEAKDCDLIVWPESSIPGYFNLGNLETRIRKLVDSLDTPILMGGARLALDKKPARSYNSCFLVVPHEKVKKIYDKIYLVPFSEHLPFVKLFPTIQKLHFGQGNFSQGEEYKVFELNINHGKSQTTKFSTLICFESIFSRVSRKFVRNEAQFLVNITDDCWFGRTPGPYQHAQQAILRAIEYRIPLVRCGNTGISYFVEPSGKVESATNIFTRRVITRRITIKNIPCNNKSGRSLTFYAKWGDWFAWLCIGVLFFVIAIPKILKIRAFHK